MEKTIVSVLFVVVMVAVIVGMDLLFFRDRFVARLIANIAVVLVFIVGYILFRKFL